MVTYPQEKPPATNIAHVWVVVEILVQERAKQRARLSDLGDEVILTDDLLDLQCRCTADRMTLISMSMGERATVGEHKV